MVVQKQRSRPHIDTFFEHHPQAGVALLMLNTHIGTRTHAHVHTDPHDLHTSLQTHTSTTHARTPAKGLHFQTHTYAQHEYT